MKEDLDTGERLSAYLAGELEHDERAALEEALARDPSLRRQLERVQRADVALRALPAVTPPPGFSERLRQAVAEDMRTRDAARPSTRRAARAAAWRPVAIAAVAACIVAVLGVGAGVLLRGGNAPREQQMAAAPQAPAVAVRQTGNNFDDRELNKLAVNVDTSGIVPPGLTREGARPLSDRLLAQLMSGAPGAAEASRAGGKAAPPAAPQNAAPERSSSDTVSGPAGLTAQGAATDAAAGPADVQRCLPQLLDRTTAPLVPVYVELATYKQEPAIMYVFAAENPGTGTYRRVEVWAVARSDCQVLSFSQYDR